MSGLELRADEEEGLGAERGLRNTQTLHLSTSLFEVNIRQQFAQPSELS